MATAFPNALRGVSVSGPVGNTTGTPDPWGQLAPDGSYAYNDPYQAQIDMLQKRMNTPQQPTFTPEQQSQRKGDNANQYALGVLGTLSGNQGLADVGGQVLKQALANRQVKYTDHGTYDPLTGEFNYSPDYLQERDAGMMQQALGHQAQGYMQWNETQSRNQQKAEAAQQHAQLLVALKGMGNGNSQANKFHPAGYAPDGTPVVTNAQDGMQYSAAFDAQGKPSYTPFQGTYTPTHEWEKNVAQSSDNLASAGRIDLLLGQIAQHQKAFGARGSVVSALPAAMQGLGANAMGLSQDDITARASMMRQASLELNHLYGAAVSSHEEARANTFLPNANDPPEMIVAKLQAARDWAKSNAAQSGAGVAGAAAGRGAGTQTYPGAPAPNAAPGGAAADPLGLRK